MIVKQLSVFLENRQGRLQKVLKTLSENKINVIALSLADTSEFGMLRMIVSEPERGREVLKAADFSAMLTDVICIKVAHAIGSLSKAMDLLLGEGINVEYMYAFANGEDASAVTKLSNPQKAIQILQEHEFEVWTAEEVYSATSEK